MPLPEGRVSDIDKGAHGVAELVLVLYDGDLFAYATDVECVHVLCVV